MNFRRAEMQVKAQSRLENSPQRYNKFLILTNNNILVVAMVISYHNINLEVSQIKRCDLSNGFHIFVFEDTNVINRKMRGAYIVAVRAPRQTLHFLRFHELKNACSSYIDYIVRYA